jgi:uncharacterized protein (DUF58 family)
MITRSGLGLAVAALVLVAAGLLSGYAELVVLGVTAAVALVLGAVWMLFRPELDADRHVAPMRVSVGTPALAFLTVANVGRRRSAPLVAEEAFGDEQILVPLPSLARGSVHQAEYPLPTDRRGIYEVGPLTVGHSDPLRLLRVGEQRGEVRRLWVYPEVHPMLPLPAGRARDLDGPTSGEAPEGGIAFHTLREYVVGDDLRLIHWRSSARVGKLMVRHNVDTNQPRVLILLDTRRAGYAGDGFEHAVSAAASIASGSVSRHFPIVLRTTDGHGAGAAIGEGPQAILDLLAAVRPSSEGDIAGSIPPASTMPGMSLAYVTGRASDADLLLLSGMRRRFDLLVVAQLSADPNAQALAIPSSIPLSAATAASFAQVWNGRFGR